MDQEKEEALCELIRGKVLEGKLPRYLYKYRVINEYFDDIIVNNRLWFSNPLEFNDPFDCNITFQSENNFEEIKEYINKHSPYKIEESELDRISRMLFENPEALRNGINEAKTELVKGKGVLCLSEDANSIIMWAHYANDHTGVCLKFDLLQDCRFFIYPMSVIYQKNYPIYDHIKKKEGILDKLVRTKSVEWSYEKEVRIIKNSTGLHEFKKEALVEIIFGVRSDSKDIERIKLLTVEKGNSEITFKKTVIKTKEYGLDFISL